MVTRLLCLFHSVIRIKFDSNKLGTKVFHMEYLSSRIIRIYIDSNVKFFDLKIIFLSLIINLRVNYRQLLIRTWERIFSKRYSIEKNILFISWSILFLARSLGFCFFSFNIFFVFLSSVFIHLFSFSFWRFDNRQ